MILCGMVYLMDEQLRKLAQAIQHQQKSGARDDRLEIPRCSMCQSLLDPKGDCVWCVKNRASL